MRNNQQRLYTLSSKNYGSELSPISKISDITILNERPHESQSLKWERIIHIFSQLTFEFRGLNSFKGMRVADPTISCLHTVIKELCPKFQVLFLASMTSLWPWCQDQSPRVHLSTKLTCHVQDQPFDFKSPCFSILSLSFFINQDFELMELLGSQ